MDLSVSDVDQNSVGVVLDTETTTPYISKVPMIFDIAYDVIKVSDFDYSAERNFLVYETIVNDRIRDRLNEWKKIKNEFNNEYYQIYDIIKNYNINDKKILKNLNGNITELSQEQLDFIEKRKAYATDAHETLTKILNKGFKKVDGKNVKLTKSKEVEIKNTIIKRQQEINIYETIKEAKAINQNTINNLHQIQSKSLQTLLSVMWDNARRDDNIDITIINKYTGTPVKLWKNIYSDFIKYCQRNQISFVTGHNIYFDTTTMNNMNNMLGVQQRADHELKHICTQSIFNRIKKNQDFQKQLLANIAKDTGKINGIFTDEKSLSFEVLYKWMYDQDYKEKHTALQDVRDEKRVIIDLIRNNFQELYKEEVKK